MQRVPSPSLPDRYPGVSNFVFLGEAGCGKSEAALNLATLLHRERGAPVHFFDLDMTKPLFRSRDRAASLSAEGILVHFEEQFMDAPTTAGGVARLLRDPASLTVLDVGGDYIGARSIGGYAPLLNRADTAVFYLINPYRPWSTSLEHIDQVLGQTLGVSHVRLDRLHLAGNPNLGPATTAEDVLEGLRTLEELVEPYKPIEFLCVAETLAPQLRSQVSRPLFPLRLWMTYPWDLPGE